ncbi:S-layer homology domain-containing protein [Paenibacillus silvisoli]|uniref:S-layer homology domain-containing protein n=1 Tax=Paenibacillus silvisoli TaxID=3110539 RepID=UPI00280452D4|nr:S-layer homology domain-containing protein [Paenibacillus silvisoli]
MVVLMFVVQLGSVAAVHGASEELKLTRGIKQIISGDGILTILDRAKLPEIAKDFMGISVWSTFTPIGVAYAGMEAFAERPYPYPETGYPTGVARDGINYVLTILYNDDRTPVGYYENKIDFPGSNGNPSAQIPGVSAETPYLDVKGSYWAADAIKAISDRKVMTGYPDGIQAGEHRLKGGARQDRRARGRTSAGQNGEGVLRRY